MVASCVSLLVGNGKGSVREILREDANLLFLLLKTCSRNTCTIPRTVELATQNLAIKSTHSITEGAMLLYLPGGKTCCIKFVEK